MNVVSRYFHELAVNKQLPSKPNLLVLLNSAQ